MKQKKSSSNSPGRPTKKSDERIKILLDCLEDNMSLDKACNYAMITTQTFDNWKKADDNFLAQVNYAKSIGVRRVLKKVEDKEPYKVLRVVDPVFRDDTPAVQVNSFRVIVQTHAGQRELSIRGSETQPEATRRIPEQG